MMFRKAIVVLGALLLSAINAAPNPQSSSNGDDYCPKRTFTIIALTGTGMTSSLIQYGTIMTRNGPAPTFYQYSYCYQGSIGIGCGWLRNRVTTMGDWTIDHSDSYFSPYFETTEPILVTGLGCNQQRQDCNSNAFSYNSQNATAIGPAGLYYESYTQCSQAPNTSDTSAVSHVVGTVSAADIAAAKQKMQESFLPLYYRLAAGEEVADFL